MQEKRVVTETTVTIVTTFGQTRYHHSALMVSMLSLIYYDCRNVDLIKM